MNNTADSLIIARGQKADHCMRMPSIGGSTVGELCRFSTGWCSHLEEDDCHVLGWLEELEKENSLDKSF